MAQKIYNLKEMTGNPIENQRYSEEEALTEAERLSDIVKASGGARDYDNAEQWMKKTGQEIRFDKKKYEEIFSAVDFILYDRSTGEKERIAKIKENLLPKLLESRSVLINAYGYREEFLGRVIRIATGYIPGDYEDEEKMRKFGLDLLAELSPKIVKDLQKGKPVANVLDAVNLLAENSDEEKRKIGVGALTDSIDFIGKQLLGEETTTKWFWNAFHSLELINRNGSLEQAGKAAEIAANVIKEIDVSKKYDQRYSILCSFLLRSELPEAEKQGFKLMSSVLEKYNLPSDVIIIWMKSGIKLSEIFERNISSIIELENKRPGVCHFLYKEFGIADFGRYPPELLLKQHEEVDGLENPYGVILFPRNDWNGAFYNDRFSLDEFYGRLKFYQRLKRKFSLRVFECEGKIGVARALLKLNKKYNPPDGSGHKISLAIIGGHGTENSIQFGGEDERNSLYLKDLMGKGVQRTSEFFEENPTIILVSCSTGADGGIGQKLSEVMGAKVIAPKVPTNIDKIHVEINQDGKFCFNAIYRDNDPKGVYVGGRENA